jgi:hypothetical protein
MGGTAATGGTTATGGSGGTSAPLPGITAVAQLDPNSCNRTLRYEVARVVYDDGQAVPRFTCLWTFDDGGTSDACNGQHDFASAGFHSASVSVSDSVNGATTFVTTAAVPVYDPLVIDVVAGAPACGLWLSYATTKAGGFNGGMYFVDIQPSQNVVTPRPWSSTATVEVSAAGTYTVLVTREEEANNALCTARDSAEATVTACP